MQVIEFGKQLNTPIVVCLGFFGCMHKGHVQLLDCAKHLASQSNSKVALFTFSNNHLRVLGKDVKQIYTFDERCEIYANLGVDVLLSANFTNQFKSNSGEQFLKQLSEYNLKGIVCGFDYSCGSDRLDSPAIVNYFSTIPVRVVDAVCEKDVKISTTYIRKLLADCQIQHANKLLSQPLFFDGEVVHGRGVGKQIGFATANVKVDVDKFLPQGVFCGNINVDGQKYKCIINIGAKPTYDIAEITVEVHLLNFEGDLYGKRLRVQLDKFVRPICKFESADELVQQLNKDKEYCLND